MRTSEPNPVALTEDQLREIDHTILDYLQEGRVTPAYCRDRILDENVRDDITSTYCGQRLQRLEEHDHLVNLFDVGLYQLTNDPRGKSDNRGQARGDR